MWFVDHARVTAKAGAGGRGCAAFAHPPYTRYPYPDGGDGGDGGDIIAVADPNIATLLDFHFRNEFKASRGRHGGGNKKTGKRGEDAVIRMPVGTVIQDADSGALLADMTRADQRMVLAKGGRGGLGNANPRILRRSRRPQTGREEEAGEATPGGPGEERRLVLELKLIADVGLVGFPNAGKSSLLARISTAHPKIAAYPFTTRYPVLGVVNVQGRGSLVACDIPGLIEGAHEGRGLGMQFLRHIERTRLLVHVVDMAGVDGRDPLEAFRDLNAELSAYSPALPRKAQVIAANKMDLPVAKGNLRRFRASLGARAARVWPISCATHEGISALVDGVWQELRALDTRHPAEPQRGSGAERAV
jgi:GTP-binding protein